MNQPASLNNYPGQDSGTGNTDDPAAYATALKQARRRRLFLLVTVLIYIPALLVTNLIIPTDRAMGTVFGIWFVFLLVATFLAALCRCPRCGNLFHVNGMALLFLRKCLHCQLHINADKATHSAGQIQRGASDTKRQ